MFTNAFYIPAKKLWRVSLLVQLTSSGLAYRVFSIDYVGPVARGATGWTIVTNT
jgi:hypothetical protein